MKIPKNTREILARLGSNHREFAKALPVICRAMQQVNVLALRSGGEAITPAKRDELLEKLKLGGHVEIELDLLAYEQAKGEQNRNYVRFRDGLMVSLGRTGKGNPFLRDHAQHTVLARGGTIEKSATEKVEDGKYQIRQTVSLTAPWAVELALRGLLGAVSIGWNPTGPVLCSECNAAIFSKCYHWPGDRLRVGDDGKKRYAEDGDIVVEWVFTEAELIETSAVNVPGVPTARIDEIRASLSAHVPDLRAVLASGVDFSGEDLAEESEDMLKKLAAILGLALTASEEEILAAAAKRISDNSTDKAELEILTKELSVYKTDLDKLNSEKRVAAEDKFIVDALSSGRIAKGDEPAWRELFKASATRAESLMGERQPNASTPVGAPKQSATEPKAIAITGGARIRGGGFSQSAARQLSAALVQLAGNPKAAAYAEHVFGFGHDSIPTTLGATAITNAADLDAAKTGFHAAFLQSLIDDKVDPISMLFTEVPSKKKVEEWNWLGDLPGFEEWKTLRKLADAEGFKLRVENKKWSSGLRLKNDDIKDDALGLIPPFIAGMSVKAKRHRFDLMIKLLLNGFDGTAYPEVGNGLGYDGAFFFADAHRGGNDNKLAVALSAAGLDAAQLLLRSMKDYAGADNLELSGTHLIVGPKLEPIAVALMTQDFVPNAAGTATESNRFKGRFQVIVSNRINGTYDDYWFLADLSQPIKPTLFQMREEISTSAVAGSPDDQSVPTFSYDEMWFGAQARYNVGYFEHRMIVGSVVA